MLKFTERSSYGKERLCKRRYLPFVDFSLSANGLQMKFSKGGSVKGAWILPNFISSLTLFSTMSTFKEAEREFFYLNSNKSPSKPKRKPTLIPCTTKLAFLYSCSSFSRTECVTGVGSLVAPCVILSSAEVDHLSVVVVPRPGGGMLVGSGVSLRFFSMGVEWVATGYSHKRGRNVGNCRTVSSGILPSGRRSRNRGVLDCREFCCEMICNGKPRGRFVAT